MTFQRLTSIGILCLSFISPALYAQSTSFYGTIDAGVEYLSNTQDSNQKTRMTNTSASQPSRFGIQGQEALSPSTDVIFKLEGGFSPSTGASMQNGRLFGRQATLGFRHTTWGTMNFGRQSTMTPLALMDSDFMGPAAFSLGSLDSYLPNARVDQSVAYLGRYDRFIFGATYSTGRDTQAAGNCPGETGGRACHAWSAMLKYKTSGWGVTAAYDGMRGGPGARPIAVVSGQQGMSFNHASDKDQRYYLNGFTQFSWGKLGGGIIHRSIDTTSSHLNTNLFYMNASIPVQQWVFDGQVAVLRNKAQHANAALFVVRSTYNFSQNTAAYASLGYMDNRGKNAQYSVSASSIVPASPKARQGQFGTLIGLRHSF